MSTALRVRRPAVAGSFYPADPRVLAADVDRLLAAARASAPADAPVPKALIVPHAGYVYSGAIAASGFVRLGPAVRRIRRIVLVGPAHRMWFEGIASTGADRLATPLGELVAEPVDLPGIVPLPRAHADEHSLEVELPFLQRVLGDEIEVVALLAGGISGDEVGGVLDALWGGPETAIVISSDLSHYLSYEEAERRDAASEAKIEALDPRLSHEDACGATPVNGLLVAARRRQMRVECLDRRNSGDTAGPRDQVVGYGAFAFYEPAPANGRRP